MLRQIWHCDLPLDSTVQNNLLNSLEANSSPPLDRSILILHPHWVSTIALNFLNIKTILDLFLRKYTQSKYNLPRTIGNIGFHQVRYFALDRKHLCEQSKVFFFWFWDYFGKAYLVFFPSLHDPHVSLLTWNFGKPFTSFLFWICCTLEFPTLPNFLCHISIVSCSLSSLFLRSYPKTFVLHWYVYNILPHRFKYYASLVCPQCYRTSLGET